MAESYIQQIYSRFGSTQNETGLKSLAKSDIMQIGNHLTGILSDRKISLDPPQLIVVGTQSSGKSSLLNRIIEMDILPTGKTMETRTPLNLQLIQSEKNVAEFGDYQDGLWKISKTIELTTDNKHIALIHDEIKVQTIKKAGSEQGICHQSIIIRLYAPHLPNLSLTDLPGLTSVACIDKGHPADIKEQLHQMIGSHIKSDRSIILLVMPARSDLEVDQAFELVKKYDPLCIRTIGIITKVDLMPTGTDISDYLNNHNISKSLQLNYGYFAVKNKGPDQSLTSKQVSDSELAYFKSHQVYSQMPQTRLGISNLTNNMSQILIDHIKNSLPTILNEINQLEIKVNKDLQEIGQQVPIGIEDQSSLIHMLVANFCREFTSSLKIRGATLNYGRQLKDAFIVYRQNINKITYTFSDELISNALTNCDSNHMLSLPSIDVLEYCLKKIHTDANVTPIEIFCAPSAQCLEKVSQLLLELVDKLIKSTQIGRFPVLSSSIKKEITSAILQQHHSYCLLQIKNLIKIEENYIWSDDLQFLSELQKFHQTIKPGKIDYNIVRCLINGYFETIKKNLQDRVPKEIMYHYVTMVENDICEKLSDKIIKSLSHSKLLEESGNISEKRKKLNEQKNQIATIKALLN